MKPSPRHQSTRILRLPEADVQSAVAAVRLIKQTKKRKPLGSAMEDFVFGTKEAAPSTPNVVSPAPQASQAAEIPLSPPNL